MIGQNKPFFIFIPQPLYLLDVLIRFEQQMSQMIQFAQITLT